jgi:predicted RNA binding protein YcfA (HicA-like mRNA interferase family)
VATSLSGATVGQALASFIERRTGKGSHLLFVHPESGKEVWVTIHRHDAGRLGNRILRDAGVE